MDCGCGGGGGGGSGILCDRMVPFKLKGKFYRTAVRLGILYGTEYRALKNQHMNKISVAKMRKLHWMCDKTRHEKIKNDKIIEC